MGSDDGRFPDDGEGPVRRVTVSEFAIACFAVSNLQFGDFVRATGYTTDAERYGWSFVFAGFLSGRCQTRDRQPGRRHAMVGAGAACLLGAARGTGEHHPRPARSPRRACLLERRQGLLPMVGGRGCRPRRNGKWRRAADWSRLLYPWGDELTPAGEHRCNIWQGDFPDLNTADDGYRRNGAGSRLQGQRLRPAQYGRQCLGMVRGLFLAAISPHHRGATIRCRLNQRPIARCAAAPSSATNPIATAIVSPRAARTRRTVLRAISDFASSGATAKGCGERNDASLPVPTARRKRAWPAIICCRRRCAISSATGKPASFRSPSSSDCSRGCWSRQSRN